VKTALDIAFRLTEKPLSRSFFIEGPRRKRRGITGNLDDGRRKRRRIRLVGAARSPISNHPESWNQNDQASGRPIERPGSPA
jgi:hypothetical protein